MLGTQSHRFPHIPENRLPKARKKGRKIYGQNAKKAPGREPKKCGNSTVIVVYHKSYSKSTFKVYF